MTILHGKVHSTAESRTGRGRRAPVHVGLVHHFGAGRRSVSGLCLRLGGDTYWFAIH